jgi:hypothetical protein
MYVLGFLSIFVDFPRFFWMALVKMDRPPADLRKSLLNLRNYKNEFHGDFHEFP